MTFNPPEAHASNKRLHELAYVSVLAPDLSPLVVGEIARCSRAFNARHGITGLIIFDGVRLCQQLEGEQKKVMQLAERIASDRRHANMQVFYHGALAARRFNNFSLAFAHDESVDLGRLEELDGEEALQAMLDLLPKLDIGA